MNAFLQVPAERRRLAFQQVDEAIGLQSVSVEKDFWVCWTLRELFNLPGISGHLTFPSFGDMITAAADFETAFNASA